MTANSHLVGVLANASSLTRACEVVRAQLHPDRCVLLIVEGDPLLSSAIEAAVRLSVGAHLRVLDADAVVRAGDVWLSFVPVAVCDGSLVQIVDGDFGDVLLRSFAHTTNARAIVLDERPAQRLSSVPTAALMRAYDALFEDLAIDALLIDDANRVVHVFGGAGRFLVAVGRVTATVIERIIPTWRAAVGAAIDGRPQPAEAPGLVQMRGLAAGMRLIQIGPRRQPVDPGTGVSRLLDNMPMMLIELDDQMRILQINAEAKAGLGLVEASVVGRHLVELQPRFAAHAPVYRRVLAGESIDLSSLSVGERHFDLHYRPTQRPDGRRGCVAIAYNVTERETVRRRLQRVADVLNAVPLGVVTVRQAGLGRGGFVLDSLCASTREQLPVDMDSPLDQPLSDIFPHWHETKVPDALLEVLRTQKSVRLEITFRPGLADARHLQLNASWLSQDLVVLTVEDISKAVQVRRRQAAAQRLEAVGQMAGGIAHDLNGRLTAILLAADALNASVSTENQGEVAVVTEATHRAADLVAQLLEFSRKRPVRPEVLTVQAIVQRGAGVLRRVLGSAIALRIELPEAAWFVRIDPGALQQTFLNLANNARAAMAAGGELCVRVTNRPRGLSSAEGSSDAADAVQIEFIDTGCGMTREIEARCFEPYFSSNDAEVSSGLGLSSVLGIVEQADGEVALSTGLGRGTRVVIALPRVMPQTSPPQRNSQPLKRAVPKGPARILVVDDEDLLRTLVVKQLRFLGYEVNQASSGEQALKVVDAEARFDMVLTDVVMPGMNGVALARRLRAADSDLRVLFMSGYTDHASVRTDGWMQAGLLEKPFLPVDLRRAVRKALCEAEEA